MFLYTKLGAPPEGRSDYKQGSENTHNGTIRLFARKRYFVLQRPFLPYLFPQEGKDMVAEGTVTASLQEQHFGESEKTISYHQMKK